MLIGFSLIKRRQVCCAYNKNVEEQKELKIQKSSNYFSRNTWSINREGIRSDCPDCCSFQSSASFPKVTELLELHSQSEKNMELFCKHLKTYE